MIKYLALALVGVLGLGQSMAAALDTAKLADITASMATGANWLQGPVLLGVIGLIVAAIILAIVKFAGKKARP